MKIKLIQCILCLYACYSTPVFAINEPLKVGIVAFSPPFTMQGADHLAYGFDIDLMNALCKIIQRTCEYRVMKFNELLPAVAAGTLDVAVSQITITSERAKMVSFTLPYLLSYSRFLGLNIQKSKVPFSLTQLNDKYIGILSGSIFNEQIKALEIKNPQVSDYSKLEDVLDALRNEDVDYILIDNATALYWVSNSRGAFVALGQPLMYGFGFGIAVNPANQALVQQLNQALLQYENSSDYKESYDTYLLEF